MQLTTEDGTLVNDPTGEQLLALLARLGLPGNGYAVLAPDSNASGSRLSKVGLHSIFLVVGEFTDREGRVRTFQSEQSSRPASFSEGEVVTVLYDPVNPSEPKIRTFGEVWALTLIALAFGVAFTGFRLVFWLEPKRSRRRRSTW